MGKILFTVLMVSSLAASAAWKGGHDPNINAGVAYGTTYDRTTSLMYACLNYDSIVLLVSHERALAPGAFVNASSVFLSVDGDAWMRVGTKEPTVTSIPIPKGVSVVELHKNEIITLGIVPALMRGNTVYIKYDDHNGDEMVVVINLVGSKAKIEPAIKTCYPER